MVLRFVKKIMLDEVDGDSIKGREDYKEFSKQNNP